MAPGIPEETWYIIIMDILKIMTPISLFFLGAWRLQVYSKSKDISKIRSELLVHIDKMDTDIIDNFNKRNKKAVIYNLEGATPFSKEYSSLKIKLQIYVKSKSEKERLNKLLHSYYIAAQDLYRKGIPTLIEYDEIVKNNPDQVGEKRKLMDAHVKIFTNITALLQKDFLKVKLSP